MKPTYSKKEAAEKLGCTRKTLNVLIQKGVVKVANFGSRAKITHAEIDRILGSRKV